MPEGTWLGLSHPPCLSWARGMFSCSVNGKHPSRASVGSKSRELLELHRLPALRDVYSPAERALRASPGPRVSCSALCRVGPAACCPGVCPCVASRSLFRTMPPPPSSPDTLPAPALLHPCRTWDVEGEAPTLSPWASVIHIKEL